jgi:hypothetical protein
VEKIRIRRSGQKRIYVHNDLWSAAAHFRNVVRKRTELKDTEGVAFDRMACLVMLAFTFEAKINFLGHKLISSWKERQPFSDKVQEVLSCLEVDPDWKNRPYLSIDQLKKFRDSIAHGKPVEIEYDETVDVPPEQVDRDIDLTSEWVQYCSQEAVFAAYDDVDVIWKELLTRSKLEIFDPMTYGSGGLTFVEKLVDKP